ncbi:MAG: phage antirepressor N-terminal domain-containing protein [Chloroflexota bacterium]
MKTVPYESQRGNVQVTMSESALVPQLEKEVVFYEDMITIAVIAGEPYVPIRPITDALGLAYGSQYNRLQRDDVLARHVATIQMTAADGKQRSMVALPLKMLPGWLFGIRAGHVKEELRTKVTRYREECFTVLWEAFQEGRLTADPGLDDLLATDSPAVQTYKMMLAMTQLARNQMLMEARLSGRLDQHEERLEQLEMQLGGADRSVTEAQAMQVSQAVKAIALELSKRSGRNEYGGVYGEFYRKFGITSYKLLPANKFQAAMDFLTEWHQSLVGDAPF